MIYLLEDDDDIRKLVVYALTSQGFETQGFSLPSAFWAAMEEQRPDLLLLDLMLPEQNGISILRQLRERPDTAAMPVIILTAKSAEYDRVEGLDAGADDYISKPFGIMELVARVRAILRRAEQSYSRADSLLEEEYRAGSLRVLPGRHEVTVEGRPVRLTNKEYSLLLLLLRNRPRVMTRQILMEKIWGLWEEPENRTLDVHIRTLRAKLGKASDCIETIRGVGYRIRNIENTNP